MVRLGVGVMLVELRARRPRTHTNAAFTLYQERRRRFPWKIPFSLLRM